MDLADNIRQWVAADNSLQVLSQRIKEVRDKKTQLTESILESEGGRQLTGRRVAISDGYLRFTTVDKVAPLTYGHVQRSLAQYMGSDAEAAAAVRFIKDNRSRSQAGAIKRTAQ